MWRLLFPKIRDRNSFLLYDKEDYSDAWQDQLRKKGGIFKFFQYPGLWLEKSRQNIMPDTLDITHPQLFSYRDYLESNISEIDTLAARNLEKLICNRIKISHSIGDILL